MADERLETIRIALGDLAAGDGLGALKSKFERLGRTGFQPSAVLIELAADALDESGASRQNPIEFEGIRDRYLPECTAHTKEQHYKSEFAIRAAAMLRAGVDPGLADEVSWWRIDDLWIWAVDALVVYLRVAADRIGEPVSRVCERLAQRHGVDLSVRV
jgi:hypothetical protein